MGVAAAALQQAPESVPKGRKVVAPWAPQRWRPPSRRGSKFGALSGAFVIEALVGSALVFGLTPKTIPVPKPVPLQVSIVHESAPTPKPPPHMPPQHLLEAPTQLQVAAPMVSITVAVPSPRPPALVVVAHTQPLPPAPRRSATAVLTFEAQVHQAVQAAVEWHYPPAARMLRQQGQAKVSFDYVDGVVSDMHLLQSSGLPLLDRAALATVRDAHYPAPPPAMQHRRLEFVVWVSFLLAGPGSPST